MRGVRPSPKRRAMHEKDPKAQIPKTQSTKHQAPSTEHRAPSTKHQAPSTKHRAPSTENLPPAMSQPAILFNGATKRFGKRTAINSLNLAIPEGSVTAFLGPNGAGKTTAIKLLMGLHAPD